MQIKNKIKLAVSSIIMASVFSGCVLSDFNTQNNKTFKEDIETRSQFIDITKEDNSYTSIQNGIYSLSGLLSIPKLGFTYFNTQERKPLYLVGYANDESFYLTQTIENTTITTDKLEQIRNDLIQLRTIALKIIKTKITQSNIVENKLVLESQKSDKFDEKYKQIVEQVKKEGLFILSWESNGVEHKSSNSNFSIIKSQDINSNNFNNSGFMILNGLKISTLYAGKDIVTHWSDINPKIRENKTFPRVITSTIQAKDIYYFSQISYKKEIQKMIDIHFGELMMKFPNLTDKNKLKQELILSISLEEGQYFNKIKNINSLGITSKMEKEVYPMFYKKGKISDIKDFINGKKDWTGDDSSNWQTIYSVDTDVFKLQKWFKNPDKQITKK